MADTNVDSQIHATIEDLRHEVELLDKKTELQRQELTVLETRVARLEKPTSEFPLFSLSILIGGGVILYFLWRYLAFNYSRSQLLGDRKQR